MRWRTGGAVFAAVLAFAAGGRAAAADAPAARKCVMYQVGDLKVRVVHNRALLDGAINGAPARVLIDTGASASLIFRAKAQALGLPLADLRGVQLGGAGGTTKAQSAYLDKLQIADATLSNISVLMAGEGRAADFDILLGEDVLGQFDIEFDLKHGAVRLLKPRGCGEGDMAYWASTYSETRLVDDAHRYVGLVVKLNGRPVRAILDSGAASSVGTPRAASASGVKLEASPFKSHGLGAQTLASEVGVLDSFSIGDETIHNAKLRFSDLFGATRFSETGSLIAKPMDNEPEMLLGFDFLLSHRVLVSRTRQMIYFTYEGGPVFDTTRRPRPQPTAGEAAAGAPPEAGAGVAPPAPPPSAATPEAAPQAAASRSPAGS